MDLTWRNPFVSADHDPDVYPARASARTTGTGQIHDAAAVESDRARLDPDVERFLLGDTPNAGNRSDADMAAKRGPRPSPGWKNGDHSSGRQPMQRQHQSLPTWQPLSAQKDQDTAQSSVEKHGIVEKKSATSAVADALLASERPLENDIGRGTAPEAREAASPNTHAGANGTGRRPARKSHRSLLSLLRRRLPLFIFLLSTFWCAVFVWTANSTDDQPNRVTVRLGPPELPAWSLPVLEGLELDFGVDRWKDMVTRATTSPQSLDLLARRAEAAHEANLGSVQWTLWNGPTGTVDASERLRSSRIQPAAYDISSDSVVVPFLLSSPSASEKAWLTSEFAEILTKNVRTAETDYWTLLSDRVDRELTSVMTSLASVEDSLGAIGTRVRSSASMLTNHGVEVRRERLVQQLDSISIRRAGTEARHRALSTERERLSRLGDDDTFRVEWSVLASLSADLDTETVEKDVYARLLEQEQRLVSMDREELAAAEEAVVSLLVQLETMANEVSTRDDVRSRLENRRGKLEDRREQFSRLSDAIASERALRAQTGVPITIVRAPSLLDRVLDASWFWFVLLASLVVALVLSVALDRVDRRILELEDVRKLDIQPAGHLPWITSRRSRKGKDRHSGPPKSQDLVPLAFSSSTVAATMEASFGDWMEDPTPTTILVASVNRHSGATFSSLALSTWLAKRGKSVLLVDLAINRSAHGVALGQPRPVTFDLANPNLSADDGLNLAPLNGMNLFTLSIVCSEQPNQDALETFASLLRSVQASFHHVLLDLPADDSRRLLEGSDVHIDRTILVAKAGTDSAMSIKKAAAAMAGISQSPVQVLLNGAGKRFEGDQKRPASVKTAQDRRPEPSFASHARTTRSVAS